MSTIEIERPAAGAIPEILRPAPLVEGRHTYGTVTDAICSIVERPAAPRAWKIAFGAAGLVLAMFLSLITYLILVGVGVWGVNNPVGWGFAIVNFVFWVGIAHAGTLISAILFLFRQKWRTSINRFAEAMTIFAVVCAGIFPGIHVGRIWLAYWMFPLPNQMAMWPNFRSPLIWDVFAVSTYATVSLLFWYMGMIPDLASLRDRAKTRGRQLAYGIFSLGWRGSQRHWHRYETAYLLLAALATPLVFSVHSVVSFDFAVAQLPGWHTTIFPPYFVVGAIFSGFAMVLMLMLPARQWFGLKDFVTMRHLENMAKMILAMGSIVGFSYSVEFFIAWYSGNRYEGFTFLNRAFGPYGWAFFTMFTCNAIVPQIFWFKAARRNLWVLFTVSILVNVGMWFERFVIVVTSLSRDFLPSSWGHFTPTWVDVLTFVGSFGLFFFLFLLFVRFLPMVAMAEVKGVLHEQLHAAGHHHHPAPAPVPVEPVEAADREKVEGVLVEFEDPEALKGAARKVRDEGYKRFDAYTPFPLHGLDHAMGIRRTILPMLVFGGGLTGALLGISLQEFTNAFDYPFIVSGKPPHSIPQWIPVTFELTILLSAFGAFLGMLILNKLPRFFHPTARVDRFRKATSDRFFLFVDRTDPMFHLDRTRELLAATGASRLTVVKED